MGRYEITAPDGNKYEITAPDTASQDEVLAYAKKNYQQTTPPTPSDVVGATSLTGTEGREISSTGPTELRQDYPLRRKIMDVVRPTLSYGGAALSAIPGAAGGTLLGGGPVGTVAGGAALAGLGYAGGQKVSDIIEELIGLRQPKPLGEQFVQTGKDIATGATAELAGQAGGKVISSAVPAMFNKLISPKADPAIMARQELFEKYGIPYSPADVSQKKSTALLEGYLKRNISSAGRMQAAEEAKKTAMQGVARNLQKDMGGAVDMLSAGQIAQETGKNRYGQFMAEAAKRYKNIPIDPTTPVETNALRDVAIGHIDDLGNFNAPAIKRLLNTAKESVDVNMSYNPQQIVDAAGQPFRGGKMPNYTWQELLSDQSALRKMSASTSDFNKKRILNNLVNAINDDIAAFSQKVDSPQIKSALDDAVKYYREGDAMLPGIKTFRDRQIMNALNTGSPEDIVKQFIKPNNVSDVLRLKQTIGDEGMQPVKQAWLEKMFRLGEEQSLDLGKFSNALNKYDDNTLRSFLSQSELRGLKELAHITKTVQNVEKLGGNPSGTAQQTGAMVDIYMLMAKPVLWSAKIIGSRKLADLYLNNPAFRETLISGMKAKQPAGTSLAIKMLTLSGVDRNMGEQGNTGVPGQPPTK